MNKNILKLAVMSVVLFTTNATQAYRWNMRNDANDILLMNMQLGDGGRALNFYVIVLPKSKANNVAQYADFDWTVGNTRAGLCLNKLRYKVVDNALYTQLEKEGIIKITNGKPVIVDNGNTYDWLKKNNINLSEVNSSWGNADGGLAMTCSSWNNLVIEDGTPIKITGKS